MSKEIRVYKQHEVVSFSNTKQKFGGLSNMAGGYTINVNDVIIRSSEALYQACRFPLHPDIQEEILNERSPMSAKMVSKKYNHFTRPDWENVKFKIMYWVLEVKLSQNWNKFSEDLINTNSKDIVEYSKNDKVWAACSNGNGELHGINALGRLLMRLRKDYIFENKSIDCVIPPDIPGFLLFNYPIEVVCNEVIESEEIQYAMIQ